MECFCCGPQKTKAASRKLWPFEPFFFPFRPAHFKLEKHTTEIPVILLSKDVGNPSRVKNQGDRQNDSDMTVS